MGTMDSYFRRAVKHIARYGDTDIFPSPIEKYAFFDCEEEIVKLLNDRYSELGQLKPKECRSKIAESLHGDTVLAPSGYSGFRSATQFDTASDAYLLALAFASAEDIEKYRLPISHNCVFSYRYAWNADSSFPFRRDVGWREFNQASLENAEAENCKYVLSADIADFYSRIYHHTIENELDRACSQSGVAAQIMHHLSAYSVNVSYGLPIGGNAARILSELALNSIDRLLLSQRIKFCRFVDDFRIFANSEEEAYSSWIFLAENLLRSEGLQLQRTKTLIEPKENYVRRTKLLLRLEDAGDPEHSPIARFSKLRLYYDPYSETATEDYEKLKHDILSCDVESLIKREIGKTRVDQTLTRKLLSAVRFLDESVKVKIVHSLFANIDALYPIFPQVASLAKDVARDAQPENAHQIFSALRTLFQKNHFVIKVPLNLIFTIRILSYDRAVDSDPILAHVYQAATNPSIKRECILAAARRRSTAWLKRIKITYNTLTPTEKRAFLCASFFMGDEGEHWRGIISPSLSRFDTIICKWVEIKRKNKSDWELPL